MLAKRGEQPRKLVCLRGARREREERCNIEGWPRGSPVGHQCGVGGKELSVHRDGGWVRGSARDREGN